MGAFTEAGRPHKNVVRTSHPVYSFAVIGYRSNEVKDVDNQSGYSDDSPFGIIKRLDGKIASLDFSQIKIA